MLQPKRNAIRIINFALSALLAIVAIWLLVNRQYVYDQITVWQFKPGNGVVQLVDRAGMSDKGKFYYLAGQPKLDGTQNFNQECTTVESSTSILGCYTNSKIYIYNVTDPRLDGIREVTAAHEALHAAYQRLSTSEKAKVNKLLEAEYIKLESKPELKSRMAFYDRTEPSERYNELHSIVGTEIAKISPELETYYKRYFVDRQKVVKLNADYSSVFKELDNKRSNLISQINEISAKIASDTDQYNDEVVALNTDIKTFNNKTFSSRYQFDFERSQLTERIATLNRLRDNIEAKIKSHDSLVKEYNDIVIESKKLYNSLDSTLAPLPSV